MSETLTARFWSKVERREDGSCWGWTGAVNDHGYGMINSGKSRNGPILRAHRVSLSINLGREVKGQVLHTCDNPPCCNPDHLYEGTQKKNVEDMHSRGRGNIGEVNGMSSLTEREVLTIRMMLDSGTTGKALAEAFKTSKATISRIKHRKVWAHL